MLVTVQQIDVLIAVDSENVHGVMDELHIVDIDITQMRVVPRLTDAHARGGIVLDLQNTVISNQRCADDGTVYRRSSFGKRVFASDGVQILINKKIIAAFRHVFKTGFNQLRIVCMIGPAVALLEKQTDDVGAMPVQPRRIEIGAEVHLLADLQDPLFQRLADEFLSGERIGYGGFGDARLLRNITDRYHVVLSPSHGAVRSDYGSSPSDV